MTDSSFPFEQAEPAPVEDDAASGGRKHLVVLGSVVGALVLAGGGYFLLGSGGEAEEDFSVPTGQTLAAPPVQAQPAHVEVVPAASSEVLGRNPFKVLYSDTSGGGAAAGGTATAGSGAAPVTTPEIIEQSKPKAPAPAPTAPAPAPAPPGTAPAPAPPPPPPPPAPEPMPADDGVRYPITLLATDVVVEGEEGKQISWGFGEKGFEVLPGQPFGRFQHLRVMQIVDEPERKGVMLQMGDSAPYFVKLGDTVYVL